MSSSLIITLDLGSGFRQKLIDIAKKELAVCTKKWKVTLTVAEKTDVLANTLAQVQNKVNFSYKTSWDFEDQISLSFSGAEGEIRIPSPEAKSKDLKFVRSNTGWIIDPDRSEDSIGLMELPEKIVKDFTAWTTTGVFYGVGSYKA